MIALLILLLLILILTYASKAKNLVVKAKNVVIDGRSYYDASKMRKEVKDEVPSS